MYSARLSCADWGNFRTAVDDPGGTAVATVLYPSGLIVERTINLSVGVVDREGEQIVAALRPVSEQ